MAEEPRRRPILREMRLIRLRHIDIPSGGWAAAGELLADCAAYGTPRHRQRWLLTGADR
ncbi:hypothetical protein ACGFIW_29835 [Micromonospora sp. NPDC048935]|uniref:hypothetical protein n=1 Tax=Micromonospora sp. NPDC048935 TaxID=3364262 RepID=UPI00371E6659